jgi:hypothetical protein
VKTIRKQLEAERREWERLRDNYPAMYPWKRRLRLLDSILERLTPEAEALLRDFQKTDTSEVRRSKP